MNLDQQLVFSDAQAVTADAASTNIIDFTKDNVGDGEELRWVVVCTEAFTNLTSLDVKLQSDDNAAFSSPTDQITVNVLLAGLTAGTKIVDRPLPRGLERYLRSFYDVNGTNPGAGKLISAIVKETDVRKAYPAGYTPGY